jgi:hypothetical protein
MAVSEQTGSSSSLPVCPKRLDSDTRQLRASGHELGGCSTAMKKLCEIVILGVPGGRSLPRPLRDARRFPSTRWYPRTGGLHVRRRGLPIVQGPLSVCTRAGEGDRPRRRGVVAAVAGGGAGRAAGARALRSRRGRAHGAAQAARPQRARGAGHTRRRGTLLHVLSTGLMGSSCAAGPHRLRLCYLTRT